LYLLSLMGGARQPIEDTPRYPANKVAKDVASCRTLATRWPGPMVNAAGWLFVAGIVIFSGSLYALTLTGVRWLGAITPFGGVAFLLGWLLLALAAQRG
jgi:uncharacterized membrane protein YgdD (TMEM256/DUF423 family)